MLCTRCAIRIQVFSQLRGDSIETFSDLSNICKILYRSRLVAVIQVSLFSNTGQKDDHSFVFERLCRYKIILPYHERYYQAPRHYQPIQPRFILNSKWVQTSQPILPRPQKRGGLIFTYLLLEPIVTFQRKSGLRCRCDNLYI